MVRRYDLSKQDVAELLADHPSYRTEQVWRGLYKEMAEPAQLSTLPAQMRRRFDEDQQWQTSLTPVLTSESDNGETVKWLYELADAKRIETVLMHYPKRSTVCISSQAGCAMNCSFCATGQAGFDRQLTSGEIIEQYIRAQRHSTSRRVDNVVFMGMGEPLANFDAVWTTIERLHHDIGLSARNITVSTVGVVPGINKLAEAPLPVNLAVSLHGANDELRNSLVPLGKRYPIDRLMAACHDYINASGRRISFEWALIDSVNDRPSDAEELANLALALRAHVNVIPLNPTPGFLVKGSSAAQVDAFVLQLERLGVNVTVRNTRGSEIDAACGQLASRNQSVAIRPRN